MARRRKRVPATAHPEPRRARAPQSRSENNAGLLSAGVTVLQLFLVIWILNPRTFFVGDSGVKYLQARILVANQWSGFAIPNPAPRIDPDASFSVLVPNQFGRRGRDADFYGAYSELFTVPVSICLKLFGMRGIYLIPILGCLGTMILTYRLSLRLAPRTAWLTPLWIGAGSPMLFYSVDLWEHTLATLLATTSLVVVVTALDTFSVWRFALAGAALGAAIAVREELYALLPAGVAVLIWVQPRQRLPAALAAVAGALAVLGPHWALKYAEVGHPAQLGFMRTLRGTLVGAPLASISAAIELVVPPAIWLIPLATAGLARWRITRASDARNQRWWCLLIAATVALWVSADAWWLVRTGNHPSDLLRTFPLTLFLFFFPTAKGASADARRVLHLILTVAAVFTAGMCLASTLNVELRHPQWGPRFLMPVLPLIAAAVAFTFEHSDEWTRRARLPPRLLAGVLAVLTLGSLAVQVQGLRRLHLGKQQYERLLAAIEKIDRRELIISDLSWFGAVGAPLLYERETLAVNVRDTGSLPALLPRLAAHGVVAFTFVTGSPLAEEHVQALAEAGWVETGRRLVPLWFHARLISYRRTITDGSGPR
jgi:hypothetical protein